MGIFDMWLPKTQFGGAGNDFLRGEGFRDTIHAGGGNDTLFGGPGNNQLFGEDGNDSIVGGGVDDYLVGGSGKDTMLGGAGWDSMDGGSGNDLMEGGDGNDRIDGGSGNDTMLGDTSFFGGKAPGNDTMWGGSGNDLMDGGAGNDVLRGGSGNDAIAGGRGADTLVGGTGADKFSYTSVDDSDTFNGSDVISDFQVGVDKIDLSRIDANLSDNIDNSAFKYVAYDEHHTLQAGEITSHYDAEIGRTVVEASDYSPHGADMHIELVGNVALTQNDFVL